MSNNCQIPYTTVVLQISCKLLHIFNITSNSISRSPYLNFNIVLRTSRKLGHFNINSDTCHCRDDFIYTTLLSILCPFLIHIRTLYKQQLRLLVVYESRDIFNHSAWLVHNSHYILYMGYTTIRRLSGADA